MAPCDLSHKEWEQQLRDALGVSRLSEQLPKKLKLGDKELCTKDVLNAHVDCTEQHYWNDEEREQVKAHAY